MKTLSGAAAFGIVLLLIVAVFAGVIWTVLNMYWLTNHIIDISTVGWTFTPIFWGIFNILSLTAMSRVRFHSNKD